MAIRSVEQGIRFPILGTIRLGEKKTSAKGTQYPTESEFFVLKDAPEVAEVYGAMPKEIDIMFPSDDEEIIIPTWYKWYGNAKTNADGEIIGGTLNCYGDGPDKEGNPGVAIYLKEKDQVTGLPPQRACHGPNCADWKNGRGQQQCKQSMQILCMIPLVSMYGVFRINTSSWNAIHNVHGMIKWVKAMNNGVVRNHMFKLKRVEKAVTYTDDKGTPQTRVHHIMELHPNEKFEEQHGGEIVKKLSATFRENTILLPSAQELVELPSPLAYQLPSAEEQADGRAKDRQTMAREIMEDPEFQAALKELAGLSGRELTDKEVMTSILKRCEEPDWRGSVIKSLQDRIDQYKAHAAAATTAESAKAAAGEKKEEAPQVDVT